jgi:predicted glycogen debranching enzyme
MEDPMAIVDASAMGLDELLAKEWLSVNQVGGFACSTAAGLNTRKYHGLLVASMAPPVRRMVLLSRVEETVIASKTEQFQLACSEYPGTIHPTGHAYLRAFSNDPFPRWAYQADGFTLEKTLRLLRGQNTVCLTYTLLAGSAKPVKLELRPLFALRGIHELCYQWNGRLDAQKRSAYQHRIPPTSRTPEVFFAHDGKFESGEEGAGCWYMSTIYRRECERGYAGLEDLWMPGVVRWTLSPGESVNFICSTDPVDMPRVLADLEKQSVQVVAPVIAGAATDPTLDSLLRAADQFVTAPPKKTFNVITQYPWSAPSGRDALMAFTGLFLIPKRFTEARDLLEVMADRMQDGIMPSEFPEDGSTPKYLGADTSLWFINAVHDLARYSGDHSLIQDRFFETVVRIIRCYHAGTSLGIQIDGDGLLATHQPAMGTTWMDAKVGDWVITPRQGRPVELNALWYSALRIAADLCARFDRSVWAGEFNRLAESVRIAFNRRFWNELAGCCFDVINDRGTDPSIRPNQLLAISLPHPVLSPDRHLRVLEAVRLLLLTPFGLRTLAPNDPSYQGVYRGDAVSRDRAYHQGSAYPWLLGPYIAAVGKVVGRCAQSQGHARNLLEPCLRYLRGEGLGQLPELFDGDAPHHPGGAQASARSVGMILQAYVEEVLGFVPTASATVSNPAPAPVQPPVVEA